MTDLSHRWTREVSIPLASEEIAALLADPASFKCKPDCPKDHPWHAKKNSDETDTIELDGAIPALPKVESTLDDAEPRDKDGKWTSGGGSSGGAAAPKKAAHAIGAKVWHNGDELTVTSEPYSAHGADWQDAVSETGKKKTVPTPKQSDRNTARKQGEYQDQQKDFRKLNQKQPSEMTAGELNKHIAKIRKESSSITDELIEAGRGHERPSEYHKKSDPLSVRAKKNSDAHGDAINEVQRRMGPGYYTVSPGFGPLKHAAAEIAALFVAPHDVSGEARDKGQFAKTQGAGAAQPTGSPLDPATGVKPPPAEHEVHKSNMDLHSKAAKTYNALVKQHLDLAKIALSPEDRAKHIESARQHKQTATHHTEQAGQHAQKMTTALQKALQTPQAPAATGPGVAGWNSINENQSIDPNKVSHTTPSGQPVAASVGSGMTHGPAIRREQERQEAAAAQNRPGGLDPKKLEEARRTREATNAAMGQPADPLDKAQQMPAVRTPTFAPSGEKPASDYQNRVGAAGVGAQKGNKPMPSPTMSPAQSADAKQKAQDVINRQFPKGVPGAKPKTPPSQNYGPDRTAASSIKDVKKPGQPGYGGDDSADDNAEERRRHLEDLRRSRGSRGGGR